MMFSDSKEEKMFPRAGSVFLCNDREKMTRQPQEEPGGCTQVAQRQAQLWRLHTGRLNCRACMPLSVDTGSFCFWISQKIEKQLLGGHKTERSRQSEGEEASLEEDR